MKRVIIAVGMILFIIGVSFYSIWVIEEINAQLNLHIESITAAVDTDDDELLNQQVKQLTDYWKEEEHKLVHIVRHAQVDEITRSISRLSALASYRNDAHLKAELDTILWLMSHIVESEPPTWQNIL